MADLKTMAESLVNLTVKEVKELADILKNDYGIEPAAAAPVMMAGGGGAAPAAGSWAPALVCRRPTPHAGNSAGRFPLGIGSVFFGELGVFGSPRRRGFAG